MPFTTHVVSCCRFLLLMNFRVAIRNTYISMMLMFMQCLNADIYSAYSGECDTSLWWLLLYLYLANSCCKTGYGYKWCRNLSCWPYLDFMKVINLSFFPIHYQLYLNPEITIKNLAVLWVDCNYIINFMTLLHEVQHLFLLNFTLEHKIFIFLIF